MYEKLSSGLSSLSAAKMPLSRRLLASFALVAAIACAAPFPATALGETQPFFGESPAQPVEEVQAGSANDGQGPLFGPDAPSPDRADAETGTYVMVYEVAYFEDGSEMLAWEAQLDEHGNAQSTHLAQSFNPDIQVGLYSDVTFDELGGMVSSVTHSSYVYEGEKPSESLTDEVVLVDERSGRVEGYMREGTTVLLGYGETGRVEQITNIYGFNEPNGTMARYDERGLPVWAANLEGHDESGAINAVASADIVWLFDAAGVPAQVCVRNAQTGAEWRYAVQTDEHGNVTAILRDDGTVVLEYAYEYVESPSPLVAAMPHEYLADVVLLAGVPE